MSAIPLHILINAVQAMDRAYDVMQARTEIPWSDIAPLLDAKSALKRRVEAIAREVPVAVPEGAHEHA